ncbi:MAG: argininosuccinate synthase [Candidatus Cloacimonadota bacterium]|nr:MAG: argininosuccinate synthase [Candidatus Cloacimonadota bacterium]
MNQDYYKVSSHEAKKGEFKRCVLLYSGGLDTSVMLKMIQERYDCEVLALTLNIGQRADDLEAIKKKALKLGAIDCIVYDAQEDFANQILSRAIKSNADYQGGYTLGCPLGRVIISQIAVEIANKYDCQVIAHGCTGKGNDQVRFEGYITTLDPSLKTIAPIREWNIGRDESIEYCKKHGIEVQQKKEHSYSYDENLWGSTSEGMEIENPSEIPKLKDILSWSTHPQDAPDKPQDLIIQFKKGIPVAIDSKKMELFKLIEECNKIGSQHGVGIFHLIEDRVVGLKVRGIYENPGASILINAHKQLERLVSTREENELKTFMDTKWAYLCYGAKWFEPTMSHIHAYVDDQNKKVNGSVTVRLYKGTITIVAIDSKDSLLDPDLVTFDSSDSFNANASAGFIELWNLPQKTAYQLEKKRQQDG